MSLLLLFQNTPSGAAQPILDFYSPFDQPTRRRKLPSDDGGIVRGSAPAPFETVSWLDQFAQPLKRRTSLSRVPGETIAFVRDELRLGWLSTFDQPRKRRFVVQAETVVTYDRGPAQTPPEFGFLEQFAQPRARRRVIAGEIAGAFTFDQATPTPSEFGFYEPFGQPKHWRRLNGEDIPPVGPHVQIAQFFAQSNWDQPIQRRQLFYQGRAEALPPVAAGTPTPSEFGFYEPFGQQKSRRRWNGEDILPVGPHVQQVNRLEPWLQPLDLPFPHRKPPRDSMVEPVGPHAQQITRSEWWFGEFDQPRKRRRLDVPGEAIGFSFDARDVSWLASFDQPRKRRTLALPGEAIGYSFEVQNVSWLVPLQAPGKRKGRVSESGVVWEAAAAAQATVTPASLEWLAPFDLPFPHRLAPFSEWSLGQEITIAATPGPLEWLAPFDQPFPHRLRPFDEWSLGQQIVITATPSPLEWLSAFEQPRHNRSRSREEISFVPFEAPLSFGWFVELQQPRKRRPRLEGELVAVLFQAPFSFGWFAGFDAPAPMRIDDWSFISDAFAQVTPSTPTPSILGWLTPFDQTPHVLHTFDHYSVTWLEIPREYVVIGPRTTETAIVLPGRAQRSNFPDGTRSNMPGGTRSSRPTGKR